MDWSFQLYSARDFQPWDGVLKMIADLGYTQVEGFGGVFNDAADFRKKLDANGLVMPTAHFSLDMLENDFEAAMTIAETFGVGTVIVPHIAEDLRPADSKGWKSFAARLSKLHDQCRSEGRQFAWHNHDFEFRPLAEGTIPMRIMLDAAPDIGWEMDVAWVARGGADPFTWIDEYGKRITAAHIKDIAPAGEATEEDGWADVGHGTLDWPALMRALRDRSAAWVFVMEHDKPSDIDRFARRSIEKAKSFQEH